MPFTDPGAERAIIGYAKGNSFEHIPAELLVPPEAFHDAVYAPVYAAIHRLATQGAFVCVKSINGAIEGSPQEKQLSEHFKASPWTVWEQDIPILKVEDTGLAIVKFHFEEILEAHRASEQYNLRKAFASEEISKEELDARWGKTHGPNGRIEGKLTIWTPSQFLDYEDDPQDVLLSNGYIEKGSPVAFCGPPGIGKSRLILQLAITSILGHGFLGWNTNAAGLKWLIFQNENGNRRNKSEFLAMMASLTSRERKMLDEALFMTAIVSDIDGDLNLAEEAVRKRFIEAVGDYKPDFVVGDPLTALSVEDLNNDQAMLNTARTFGAIARINNPKAVPALVQHARTGKEAQSGMSGFNRSSYARNSKALHGWIRAQFNLGPVEEKKNDRLFFASGKCNNAAEFDEFVIELDPVTRFYSKTTENAEEVRNARDDSGNERKRKFTAWDLKEFMSTTVPLIQAQVMHEVCGPKHHKCATRTFKAAWADAKELGLITEETKDKYLWKG